MRISDIATVRTGLVTTREKKKIVSDEEYHYRLLNLRSIDGEGNIIKENLEDFHVYQKIKEDCLTQMDDILVRLSYPYTAVFIRNLEMCGLVVPSHYAIIRVNTMLASPKYVYWVLKRNKNLIRIMKNSSNATVLGTISSGQISELPITLLQYNKQETIGQLNILSEREQNLLAQLSEYKKKYNTQLLNTTYNTMKRRNKK